MDTFGIHSPIPSSIGFGMTVAMGILDRDTDGLVVTDSREADEEKMILKDEVLKSIRVNEHCALAFSGDAVAANRIAAHIYQKSPEEAWMIQAIYDGRRDVLQTIEDKPLEISQSPHLIAHWINGYLIHLRAEESPKVNVILVGREDRNNYMWSWSWQEGYAQRSGIAEAAESRCSLFGPGDPTGVVEKLKDLAVPLDERIRIVAEMYRRICPCGVNLDLKMRRASNGFILEPLANLSVSS